MEDSVNVKLYSQAIMDITYMYIYFTFMWHIYKEKFNRFCTVEIIQFPFTGHIHKVII